MEIILLRMLCSSYFPQKHIKCISYKELKEGKEIHEKCRNWLGNRKEFETDKDLIIDYCKYAIKFFENVE